MNKVVIVVGLAALVSVATSAPAGISLPFLTLDNGNIGVRFGGYHASAGLGGLLSGDLTKGGLHAEAGTPFGQAAGAGLGGVLGSNGGTAGGLYAGATAGNGVEAAAGLGGATSGSGAAGGSFAAASSGASAGAVQVGKVGYGGGSVENVAVAQQPQKEIIERTVIPNYVEKTIQVPSYVEKTVRVPTYVEKRVRVPVAPTVIEKTVSAAPSVAVVESTNIQTVPSTKHSVKITSRNHGDRSKVKIVERVHPNSGVVVTKYNGSGGGVSGAGAAAGAGAGAGGYSFTKTASASPQLFNDIFNIPISTLGAVNRLLNGISGGTSASGSFAVSKSFAGAY